MQNIVSLLGTCKLEAVAHRNEEMLLKVNETVSVGDALQTLRDRNVLSMPVVSDGKGQFSGVFSVTDILRALVKGLNLDRRSADFRDESDKVVGAMKKVFASPVSAVMHAGDLWYLEQQNATVMDAVKDMLQRTAVHHRLFTCKTLKDTQPTGILSQSDVVQLMWDHKVELGEVLDKTVEDMGLCAAAAETAPATATTLQVLLNMWRDKKSCMGITAGHGELVGNLSISDLRGLTPDLFSMLGEPVGAFMLAIRGLPVPQEKNVNWSAALRAVPVHIVTPSTAFKVVLQALSVNKLHRLYVVDHAEHSIGIITLTDILRQLLPKPEAYPEEGPGGGLPRSVDLGEADADNGAAPEQ